MTKDQAIKHLKLMQSGARNAIRFTKNDKEISEEERKEDIEIYQDQLDALEMAIKALEQQTINCNATTEEIAQSFKADVEAVKDYLPKCNSMEFPKTFDEFANDYGFTDDKKIYTNGSHLIPVFRVNQWLDHIEQPTNDCKIFGTKENCFGGATENECNHCDYKIQALEQQSCDDCVSRAEAIKALKESAEHHANDTREEVLLRRDRDIIRALPPVTPTHCIAAIRFSKEDLREICNERIEVECTHGTCKDCKRGQKCEHGVYCTNLGGTNEENWYCADFKKRGNEK